MRCTLVAALAALTVTVPVGPLARAGAAGGDPLFDRQYGPQQVNAPAAWPTSTGRGVVIAVVDTGVDLQHPDLAGKLVAGIDLVDTDTVPQDCPVADERPACGHGTHVAGIAAAATNNGQGIAGVAPEARIMPVRVLGTDGRGTSDRVNAGIRWAVDHGARVVNLSLAGDVTLLDVLFGNSLESGISYAWSKGAVVVAAAGNLPAAGANQPSGYSSGVKAIVVTATDRDRRHPSYANRADTDWSVAAPGDDVLSTLPGGYGLASGTSMAAPHVAGVAALLLAQGRTNQQVVERILSTAHPLGPRSLDGAGLVDAAAAVGAAAPAPAPAPPATSAPAKSSASASAPPSASTSSRPGAGSVPPTGDGSGAAIPGTGRYDPTKLPLSLPSPGAETTVPYVPPAPQPAPELVPLGEFAAPDSTPGGRPRGVPMGVAAVLLGAVMVVFMRSWRRVA